LERLQKGSLAGFLREGAGLAGGYGWDAKDKQDAARPAAIKKS
jgi:hypothetical protein